MCAKYTAKTEMIPGLEIEQIVLEGEGQVAKLAPAKGGNLFSYVVDGAEMLETPASFDGPGTGYGFPVMFPYANRIVDATFQFKDKKYQVVKNGVPKVLHGIVNDEAFTVEDVCACEDKASATISIEFAPGGVLYTIFPFYLKLYMTYSISKDGLRLDWAVENKDSKEAPFGFGVHTFFNKLDPVTDTYVTVPNRLMMETDNCYPTRKMLDTQGTSWDLSEGKCLAEMNFDNLFGGFDSTKVSTIEYRKSGRKLELRASDDMKYMVIFTPPMRAGGFCLENQTNATDGFNMLAQGKKDMGNVIVLPAGGRHEGWITLQAGYLK